MHFLNLVNRCACINIEVINNYCKSIFKFRSLLQCHTIEMMIKEVY